MEQKVPGSGTFEPYELTEERISKRVDFYTGQKPSGKAREDILRRIITLIDLTTLEGSDNRQNVGALCERAGSAGVAAVCVYPSLIGIAREALSGSAVKLASVAGGFPAGQIPVEIKLSEIGYAVTEGAEELDVVISRGKLLEGREEDVFNEIVMMREAAGALPLKVILETGELKSVGLIRRASEIAILGGAGFLKTSTGKISTGATGAAFTVMADTIREYFRKTGNRVGIKASGGIRSADQALDYYLIAENILGEEWLTPGLFRFGASSLLDSLTQEIGSQ